MQLGPIALPTYASLVYLGLLGGALLTYLETRHRRLPPVPIVDAALTAGVGSVLLGRALYVAVHWGYYQTHLAEALRPWDGGLAWQGALLGGVMGTALACAARGVPVTPILDLFTPAAGSVAVFAWLGCHVASCAYGVETYPGQGLLWRLSLDLPDLYGIRQPRIPVQLLGAGGSALILTIALIIRRRIRRPGTIFALWVSLQSLGSFGLGLWRADSMPQMSGWRVDHIVNLFLCGVGLATALAMMIRQPPDSGGG